MLFSDLSIPSTWGRLDRGQRLTIGVLLLVTAVVTGGVAWLAAQPARRSEVAVERPRDAEVETGAGDRADGAPGAAFFHLEESWRRKLNSLATSAVARVFRDRVDVTVNLELKKTTERSSGANLPEGGLVPNVIETTTESSEAAPPGRGDPDDPDQAVDVRARDAVTARSQARMRREMRQLDATLYGTRTVDQLAPMIERITVAVVIHEAALGGIADPGDRAARVEDIKAIVMNAVGFDPERGDRIEARVFDRIGPARAVPEAGAPAAAGSYAQVVAAGLAVLLVFLIGRGLLRRTRAGAVAPPRDEPEPSDPAAAEPQDPAPDPAPVLEPDLPPEPVAASGDTAATTLVHQPFAEFEVLPPEDLAELLVDEHPQIAAVFLAHLDGTKGGAVVDRLPEARRADLIYRVATLDRTPPEVVQRVLDVMRQKVEALGLTTVRSEPKTWIKAAAEILNHVGGGDRRILEAIGATSEDIAGAIREAMFKFEDLARLERRAMQAILAQVDSRALAVALKATTAEVEANVFDNLSRQAGDMVAEEREALGPTPLSQVLEAQRRILLVVRDLVDRGEIAVAPVVGEQMV